MTARVNGAKAKPRTTRNPRGSLSSEAILAAAFELAEEASVEKLSMPKLAKRLDVGVTSLYWYFRSKEDLLDAMIAQSADDYLSLLSDHPDTPWDKHFRLYFREMKQIFHDNPVMCDFLVFRRSAATVTPRLRFLDRINHEVTVLIDAGFDPETAARGYQAMSVYTQGVVHKQRLFHLSDQTDDRFMMIDSRRIWAVEPNGQPAAYPGLEASLDYWSASFASDEEFEAGLDFIIEGLRSKLPTTDQRAARKARTS
ncbi:hypothetical protein ASG88_17735 [Nocardioides sp. Soil777]|uniref:TetR/AcrR family transcriptional regulator n=1 Tax=Nocardioides sp. Soil777 TaxID=1736409 RepID=UPI0007037A79|nr:TetR/AcrR family transcriptional regulator [Nocardioides sp. Soil777]KRE98020.1 hypothetical protein ASG88_17735 [Nocardioides sp. Soil777]